LNTHDKEDAAIKAIAYILTALIMFGVPFGIGLIVGHIFW
jgi:hypothetical protein